MVADYAAGDAKAIAEAYAEDAVMLAAPDATVVSGREAIAKLWKGWIDDGLKDLTLKSTAMKSASEPGLGGGRFLAASARRRWKAHHRTRQLCGGLEARRRRRLAAQGRHLERRAV